MIRAIICDLDNVIFDSRCMNKYIPKDLKSREGWNEFNKHYDDCYINFPIISLVLKYAPTHKLLFITGREKQIDVYKLTWNTINEIFPNVQWDLFMREIDDFRNSDIVKKEIYKNEIKTKFNVELAFDDDLINIKMWQILGIPTLQFRFGDGLNKKGIY